MNKIFAGLLSAALTVLPALPASASSEVIARQASDPAGNPGVNSGTQHALPKGVLKSHGSMRLSDRRNGADRTAGLPEFHGFGAAKTPVSTAPKKVQPIVASGTLPTLIGTCFYSVNSGHNGQLMQIPINDTQEYSTILSGVSAEYCSVLRDNIYITTTFSSFMGMTFISVKGYDLETEKQVYSYSPSSMEYVLEGSTYDPTTDRTYVIGFNAAGDGLQLATADYTATSATFTHIADFNHAVAALTCDAQGQLYALLYDEENSTTVASYLAKIDKETGAVDVIGDTGEISNFTTGGAIDPKTGVFYWPIVAADGSAWLTTVDLTTGAATRVNEIPDGMQFRGVHVMLPAAEAAAPAAVTDLALDFESGSLSGKVSFNVPATLFDGSAASGELSYTVMANGETVATGTTTYGSAVAAEVTLPAPGDYEFVVYTSNEAGRSPNVRIKDYVGNGVPKSPVLKASYADGQLSLSWNAITESIDGGYIDAEAVTYTVKNITTGEVLAEGITATSWNAVVAEPDELTVMTYAVIAVNGGVESTPGQASVVLGSIEPPYFNNFDTTADWSTLTIINVNGDAKTWEKEENGGAKCSFNTIIASDDWLVTPPLRLEANTAYFVSIDARGNSATSPETFEVCSGRACEAEAFTQTVIPVTEIRNDKFTTYTGYIITEEAGIYYLGIHAMSVRNMYALVVDNLSIEAGRPALAPSAVTDLEIAPAAYGARFAEITFNAPSTTVSGAELSEITKIEVARDGEVIDTKLNVTPGSEVKVADNVDDHGTYTYTVTAYNEHGAGEAVTKQAYIGVAIPAPVSKIDVDVNADGSQVTLSWPAVNRDMYDNPISPDQVTYNILNEELQIIAEGLTSTTWKYDYTGTTQEFVMFGVQPVTEGGRANAVQGTHLIAVGPAYPELNCSFVDGGNDGYVFYTRSDGGTWIKATDDGSNGTSKFETFQSYDGDNGFIAMEGKNEGDAATIISGVVSLKNAENPGVSFYTYVLTNEIDEPDENTITVGVAHPNSTDVTPVETIVVKDLGKPGWRKATVRLDDYAGQDIQIALTAKTVNYVYTPVDNLKVGSLVAHDLTAHAISAPGKVVAGDDYSVIVEVVNDGFQAADAFKVELYANGELVDTKDCAAVSPATSAFVEFVRSFNPIDPEAVIYSAAIVYAADENTSNNTTDEIVVEPIASVLPGATDLKGEATDEGNHLTWNVPDTSSVLPDPVTETFEDATDFSTEYKDWLFVDVDGAVIGGLTGYTLPNIPTAEGPCSWFVFDASNEQYSNNTTFYGANGAKDKHYLACLYRKDYGQLDDWAISPELNGAAQTLTFKARAYYSYYAEKFEIWYSTGSVEVADFVQLGEAVQVKTSDWTEYSFELPEGAKRFAIRSCAVNSYMLFLDDVTFIPASAKADVTLVGYDIYRDAVKINADVVTETSYTDTEAEAGKPCTYNVVAVFTRGTAIPSNDCNLTTSALDALFGGINITAGQGEIVINGADGLAVQVVAVDGKVLFSGLGEHTTSVAVLPGVYVVKAGDKIAKLAVR